MADSADEGREVLQADFRIETTSMPFLPPDVLERFEAIHPGFTARMLDQVDAQIAQVGEESRGQLEMARSQMRNQMRLRIVTEICAAVVGVAFAASAATIAIMGGSAAVAIAIGVAGPSAAIVGSLVSFFRRRSAADAAAIDQSGVNRH